MTLEQLISDLPEPERLNQIGGCSRRQARPDAVRVPPLAEGWQKSIAGRGSLAGDEQVLTNGLQRTGGR